MVLKFSRSRDFFSEIGPLIRDFQKVHIVSLNKVDQHCTNCHTSVFLLFFIATLRVSLKADAAKGIIQLRIRSASENYKELSYRIFEKIAR